MRPLCFTPDRWNQIAPAVQARIQIEYRIVSCLVRELLDHSFSLSLHDGEDTIIHQVADHDTIMKEIMSVDGNTSSSTARTSSASSSWSTATTAGTSSATTPAPWNLTSPTPSTCRRNEMARSTPKLNPQLQLFHEMFARHPMLLAFAIEGVHRYAEQILAMDKAQWPEGHFVTFELWQSLAAQAKEILK